jgi:hypothetical protein
MDTSMHAPGRTHRVHASVFASLLPGEIRIVVLPGDGFANGGALWDVPTTMVPCDCRMPNTLLWFTYQEGGTALGIEPRAADDETPMY